MSFDFTDCNRDHQQPRPHPGNRRHHCYLNQDILRYKNSDPVKRLLFVPRQLESVGGYALYLLKLMLCFGQRFNLLSVLGTQPPFLC